MHSRSADGATYQQIADATGVHVTTVQKAVSEAVLENSKTEIPETTTGKDGKTYPTRKPRKAGTAGIFAKDKRSDGMTLQQIADVSGVDASTVKRALDHPAFANAKADLPEKTTGADGKQYPTSYKPRKAGTSGKSQNPDPNLDQGRTLEKIVGASAKMRAARMGVHFKIVQQGRK